MIKTTASGAQFNSWEPDVQSEVESLRSLGYLVVPPSEKPIIDYFRFIGLADDNFEIPMDAQMGVAAYGKIKYVYTSLSNMALHTPMLAKEASYNYNYYPRFNLGGFPEYAPETKLYAILFDSTRTNTAPIYTGAMLDNHEHQIPQSWQNLRHLKHLYLRYQRMGESYQLSLIQQLEQLADDGFMRDDSSATRYIRFDGGGANKNLPITKQTLVDQGWGAWIIRQKNDTR